MVLFLVDILLVVMEEVILFGSDFCRFECHFETMRRIWRLLDIVMFSLVDFAFEIERVSQLYFLPGR